VLMCAMLTILFFGGWHSPIPWGPLEQIPLFWFGAKVVFFFFLFAMVKAIVPRYRYDQLMRLGWKVFLPMSLLFVAATSGYLMATGHFERVDTTEAAGGPATLVHTTPAQPQAVRGQS